MELEKESAYLSHEYQIVFLRKEKLNNTLITAKAGIEHLK